MLFSDRVLRASDEDVDEDAAPSRASLPIATVKGGYDARPTIGWESNLFERSRASSFPDKPTGTDTILRNDGGESGGNGRENIRWWKFI